MSPPLFLTEVTATAHQLVLVPVSQPLSDPPPYTHHNAVFQVDWSLTLDLETCYAAQAH